jgi:hypothetical protein
MFPYFEGGKETVSEDKEFRKTFIPKKNEISEQFWILYKSKIDNSHYLLLLGVLQGLGMKLGSFGFWSQC